MWLLYMKGIITIRLYQVQNEKNKRFWIYVLQSQERKNTLIFLLPMMSRVYYYKCGLCFKISIFHKQNNQNKNRLLITGQPIFVNGLIWYEIKRIIVFLQARKRPPLPAGKFFCPFSKFFLKNRLRFDTLIPNKWRVNFFLKNFSRKSPKMGVHFGPLCPNEWRGLLQNKKFFKTTR